MTLNPQSLVSHFVDEYGIKISWAPAEEISLDLPLIEFIKFLYMNNYSLEAFQIDQRKTTPAPARDIKRLRKILRILSQEQPQPAPMWQITQFGIKKWMGRDEEIMAFTGYDAKHPERPYFHITLDQFPEIKMVIPWFVNNKHGMAHYEKMVLSFTPTPNDKPIVREFNERFAKYGFRIINYTHRNHLPRFLFD